MASFGLYIRTLLMSETPPRITGINIYNVVLDFRTLKALADTAEQNVNEYLRAPYTIRTILCALFGSDQYIIRFAPLVLRFFHHQAKHRCVLRNFYVDEKSRLSRAVRCSTWNMIYSAPNRRGKRRCILYIHRRT